MQRLYQVGSVTNAMRAKRILEKHGIRAYIRRSTDQNGNTGCGYAILVPQSGQDIASLLIKNGVSVQGGRGSGGA